MRSYCGLWRADEGLYAPYTDPDDESEIIQPFLSPIFSDLLGVLSLMLRSGLSAESIGALFIQYLADNGVFAWDADGTSLDYALIRQYLHAQESANELGLEELLPKLNELVFNLRLIVSARLLSGAPVEVVRKEFVRGYGDARDNQGVRDANVIWLWILGIGGVIALLIAVATS